MPDQMMIYRTLAIAPAMDGETAVLTFISEQGLPVAVQVSRDAFRRFVAKANDTLASQ